MVSVSRMKRMAQNFVRDKDSKGTAVRPSSTLQAVELIVGGTEVLIKGMAVI